jgi:hypothetical protein
VRRKRFLIVNEIRTGRKLLVWTYVCARHLATWGYRCQKIESGGRNLP